MDITNITEVIKKHHDAIQNHINLLDEVDNIEQINESFITLIQAGKSAIAYMESRLSYLDKVQMESNSPISGELDSISTTPRKASKCVNPS